jgi:hypothetical protein
MATLAQAELDRIARWYQRDQNFGQCAFTKPDLAAAVTALDAFLSSNAAAVNSALPTAFRTTASTQQKALLLAYVALRRYGADITAMGGD